MSEIRTFKDLKVWQKGMGLAKAVYRASSRMPETERFGLTNQMRRAAVSIPSNIAEGYARQTTPEYLRSLRVARGSLAELYTQFELAMELEMIPDPGGVPELIAEEDRMLQSLIMRLESRPPMKNPRSRSK
jgi:four helix bundle protein